MQIGHKFKNLDWPLPNFLLTAEVSIWINCKLYLVSKSTPLKEHFQVTLCNIIKMRPLSKLQSLWMNSKTSMTHEQETCTQGSIKVDNGHRHHMILRQIKRYQFKDFIKSMQDFWWIYYSTPVKNEFINGRLTNNQINSLIFIFSYDLHVVNVLITDTYF